MSAVVDGLWWIGGSPCSGKSTVAGIVSASRNILLYSCDDAFERHAATIQPTAGPTLKKVTAMSIEDRLAQPIGVQVGDVFRLYREEGAALLPELLASQNVPPERAVWVVPTEDFQRRQYRQRTWARNLLASAVDPERAFIRWMQRDAAFAQLIADQARELGYPVITVDGTAGATDIAAAVNDLLAPSLA
jgi:2-phosphoglycerate kinase